jgi:hypothetical protein
MEADIRIERVEAVQTRSGNTRYVLHAGDGHEYTTFREEIGRRAKELEGRRVRIEYHEEQRGRFHNVYVDDVAPVQEHDAAPAAGQPDSDPEEAAWSAAVDAAPYLIGERKQGEAVPPEELYERLEPFKRLVADDIRESEERAESDRDSDA